MRFVAISVLGTGYMAAITRVPGPGFNFEVMKENDNAMTCTHQVTDYFLPKVVFSYKTFRNCLWDIKC